MVWNLGLKPLSESEHRIPCTFTHRKKSRFFHILASEVTNSLFLCGTKQLHTIQPLMLSSIVQIRILQAYTTRITRRYIIPDNAPLTVGLIAHAQRFPFRLLNLPDSTQRSCHTSLRYMAIPREGHWRYPCILCSISFRSIRQKKNRYHAY